MLGNALRGLPVNKKEQPKPLNGYSYPQLTAFKSTKAPGQYSTGTGGQYSTGANSEVSDYCSHGRGHKFETCTAHQKYL